MQIDVEKSYVIAFSESELNTLRCFLDEALSEGVWEEFKDDSQKFITDFYRAAVKATTGVIL